MFDGLVDLAWPRQRLGEALDALARASGLFDGRANVPLAPEPRITIEDEALGRWIKTVADEMNLEAESVFSSYSELEQMLSACGPGLLQLRLSAAPCFLALLGRRGKKVAVLAPDLKERRVNPSLICAALRHALEAPLTPKLDQLLAQVGVPRRKRSRARAAILRERLSAVPVGGFRLLRISPRTDFRRQLRQAGAARYLSALAGAHVLQYLLWLAAWWVVGRGALQGRLDYSWMIACAVLLLTIIPLRLLTTWLQGTSAIGAAGLLKLRLLYGALRLDPEQIRNEGAGQLLGRVIETESFESLALSGGFQSVLAGTEICMAALVLGAGSGGWLHAGLLLLWIGVTLAIGWRYFKQRRRWTRDRMSLTNDLVEGMVGHRTRLAQQPLERWHEAEDQSLEIYHGSSKTMDRTAVLLWAFVPRGWLVIGVLGLAPAFIRGPDSTAALAVALGGTILAYAALRRLAAGIAQLTDAVVAWRQVESIFRAAADPAFRQPVSALAYDSPAHAVNAGGLILDARELVFRYQQRNEPVINGCSLRIFAGDKLLLEGPSGGGKSTLASLMEGLRQPESGLLLLRGLDRGTLGDENWRRLVVSAPQFHENHVMTETLAFNLLMGRRWPAGAADLAECEEVCGELGLSELIERMPAGLMQMVGETGWQLSHGERSRLFIARAILQHADLVVLDESFAALDPENLRRALTCVLNRTATLMVIAHP